MSTQRQNHRCEWLLRAAFSLSSQPDTATTVDDDNAANLPPSAHAGSTRHRIPCRVGYRATWDPRLQCIPGKGMASTLAREPAMRLGGQSRRHMPLCQLCRCNHTNLKSHVVGRRCAQAPTTHRAKNEQTFLIIFTQLPNCKIGFARMVTKKHSCSVYRTA